MNDLIEHIDTTLGTRIEIRQIPREDMGQLALYIREAYNLYEANLLNHPFLLVEPKAQEDVRILQLQKHLNTLEHAFNKKSVLLLHELAAYMRQRLIEKQINFIIPGKQTYLPAFLIDLKEESKNLRTRPHKPDLVPAAQFLMLYHLLHRNENEAIEDIPLNEVGMATGYTPTMITQAVADLVHHGLIDVNGTKEKTIHFRLPARQLWQKAIDDHHLTNPVLKRIYVDELPLKAPMLKANMTAMAEYTDLNPDGQTYYAIGRRAFQAIEKEQTLRHPNPVEGAYCIEVWKYNPIKLAKARHIQAGIVDPLSLYLSMQDHKDERIEMGLDQIINQFQW